MNAHVSTVPAITGDTTLAGYIEKVNQFPYLSAEEELSLAQQLLKEGDITAAHKLVTSHLRLVVKIAHGFKGYGLPMLEMISEGNIGLMQAVKKFDPDKGFRLSTYAMWWIKASIQEYVLHSWSLVKIGTTAAQKKLFFGLRKIKNRIQKVDNTQLSSDEIKAIAAEMNVSERDVLDMDSRLTQADQSLNVPAIAHEDSSDQLIDMLESQDVTQEVIAIEQDELDHKRSLFAKGFALLNEREQAIITKRRLTEPFATLEDLSQEFDISRERVRQIEARAMEKLQDFVTQEAS